MLRQRPDIDEIVGVRISPVVTCAASTASMAMTDSAPSGLCPGQ